MLPVEDQAEGATPVDASTEAPTTPVEPAAGEETQVDAQEPTTEEPEVSAPALTPTLTEEQAKAMVAVERERWEKEDAAKIQATFQKKLNAERAEVDRLKSQRLAEAESLMPTNPQRAAEIYQEESKASQARDAVASQRQQWQEFAVATITDLGLDPADEELAEELVQASEWLVSQAVAGQGQQAIVQFTSTMSKRAVEAARKETADVRKQATNAESEIDQRVKAEVANALGEAGIVPQSTTQGGPVQRSERDSWKGKTGNQLLLQSLEEDRKRLGK